MWAQRRSHLLWMVACSLLVPAYVGAGGGRTSVQVRRLGDSMAPAGPCVVVVRTFWYRFDLTDAASQPRRRRGRTGLIDCLGDSMYIAGSAAPLHLLAAAAAAASACWHGSPPKAAALILSLMHDEWDQASQGCLLNFQSSCIYQQLFYVVLYGQPPWAQPSN